MVGMSSLILFFYDIFLEYPADLMDAENVLAHVFKLLISQMTGQVENIQKYLDDQYIAAHSPNL